MHSLLDYDPKVLMAFLKSLEGDRKFSDFLMNNGYRELEALSSAIHSNEAALQWLLDNGYPEFAVLSNAIDNEDAAIAWLDKYHCTFLATFAAACRKEDAAIKWFVDNVYGDEPERILAERFNKEQTSKDIITKYFAAYSKCFDFSLRKMEQVFDRFLLFTKQINVSKELFSPDLATFLLCLHEADSDGFDKIRNLDNSTSSVIQTALSTVFENKINKHKKVFSKTFEQIDRNIVPEVLPIAWSSSKNRPTDLCNWSYAE